METRWLLHIDVVLAIAWHVPLLTVLGVGPSPLMLGSGGNQVLVFGHLSTILGSHSVHMSNQRAPLTDSNTAICRSLTDFPPFQFNFFIRDLLGCVKHCYTSLWPSFVKCQYTSMENNQKVHTDSGQVSPKEKEARGRGTLGKVARDLVAGCGFSFSLLTHKNHEYSTFPPVFWFSW